MPLSCLADCHEAKTRADLADERHRVTVLPKPSMGSARSIESATVDEKLFSFINPGADALQPINHAKAR
jgi:hypothetical protein